MSRTAAPIVLAPDERATLDAWTRGRRLSHRKVVRAKIITMAADKVPSQDIAAALQVSRPTVQLWRERFLALRVAGLEQDAPRPGRKPRVSVQKIRAVVDATLHTTPPAATHWSTRTLARAQGLSQATVQRIWKRHNLQPHRVETFKLSRDQHFLEKLTDVVGLYLNPPDKSLVLCVDEKSQIQALDRTQPGLPLKRGRCGTQTHDYKRNGTTTLFAALSMLDGKVIGDCMPRHRHQEFLRFLKKIDAEIPAGLDLHLIVDNYGTHKHPRVKSWLRRHPRFHLHFIPTSSSWLNLVERWFRELTDKRIRRGSFANVAALIAAIEDYLANHNQNPRVFVWSAPVERILAKIAKCKEALDSVHYVVGWLLARQESAALAKVLITESCARQHIAPDQLIIHADRGPSMTSQPVALLLATLGVVPSHSRPHVSNGNPFSEAQFKTLKYRPDFPDRFGSYEDAEAFGQRFFPWYNREHRHGALGLMTPHDMHYGLATAKWQQRAAVLRATYAAHPERFPRGVPVPPLLPTAAWINKPPAAPALAVPEGIGS